MYLQRIKGVVLATLSVQPIWRAERSAKWLFRQRRRKLALKATLILAESATVHPDGTFSILRGGITHVWGDKPPVGFRGVMFVRIEGNMADKGSHKFDLRGMDQDGKEFVPKLEGQFKIPTGGGNSSLMLNMQIGFPQHGKYVFVVRIDDKQEDDWGIFVKPAIEKGKP